MPEFFTSVHHKRSSRLFRKAWKRKITDLLLPYSTQVPSAETLWFRFPRLKGSKHISVVWFVHDMAGRERTQDWVDEVSKDILTPGLMEVLEEFDFPEGTELSVDGFLVSTKGMGYATLKKMTAQ